jgi:hypothetical protein
MLLDEDATIRPQRGLGDKSGSSGSSGSSGTCSMVHTAFNIAFSERLSAHLWTCSGETQKITLLFVKITQISQLRT